MMVSLYTKAAGLAALAAVITSCAAAAADVREAWFADAAIAGAAKSEAPSQALSSEPGSCGTGVRLADAVPMDWPELQRQQGYISFWIKPDWSGNDGMTHRLLRIGDPQKNGLAIEKSSAGMLRFIMASPEKTTVSRASVAEWKPGQWHHVAAVWFSRENKPLGLPLWVDRVAADGPVAGGCTFLDPETIGGKRLWIGDPSSGAVMDELILRTRLDAEGGSGQTALVYRDYFRTAPYDAIEITHEPLRVPSDRRAMAGFAKQFGLMARREGQWEPVTDYVVRYGQWAEFDAKPFIQWSSSDAALAEVDTNGCVSAKKAGAGEIRAWFRGMQAGFSLSIESPDKPDLDLICLEMLPRYACDAVKNRPSPGEAMTLRLRLGNYGLKTVPPGAEVRLDLVPVAPVDGYRFDPGIKPVQTFQSRLDQPLEPGNKTVIEFKFPFPSQPMWMRARLDPNNEIDEFCEANNEIAERTDARPIQLGFNQETAKDCLASRKINHVGSLSCMDWVRAQKLRMDVMLRDAVSPTTGPHGVEEAYRVDAMTPLTNQNLDDQQYRKQEPYFDGGFPINEPVNFMAVDAAIIHEFGHTILSQPDLYGYSVKTSNVLLTDESGRPYAGTDLMPRIGGGDALPFSPGINTPCGIGYVSLMDSCHLWLHPAQAGHIVYFKGFRQDRFWGTQGRLIAGRAHWLLVADAEDRPLTNAAVMVYHVFQAPVNDAGAKYFADRPKFTGHTDAEGRFVFPRQTDADWDDPETEEADGAIDVWNPFVRVKTDTAFTPNVWTVEGLLLVKITTGKKTEFHWLDLLQFNEAFHSGGQVLGIVPIRTSLASAKEPEPIVRKAIPEAVRKVNKRPVAVAPKELTVQCGADFEIDGSRSYDPEGQPLLYRWSAAGQWLGGDLHQGPVFRAKAPGKPGTVEYRFYVLDGICCSEAASIKIKAVLPE